MHRRHHHRQSRHCYARANTANIHDGHNAVVVTRARHCLSARQYQLSCRHVLYVPYSPTVNASGTNIFGGFATRIGRWRSSLIGLIIIGFCLIFVVLTFMKPFLRMLLQIPMAESVMGLILPNGFMGFAIGRAKSLLRRLLCSCRHD